MANKVSLSIGLLLSFFLAYGFSGSAIAIPQTHIAVEPQVSSPPLALTKKDLPAGFRELPPSVANQIAAQLQVVTQNLGQQGIKPEKFFAFVNPQNFQLVFGFTTNLKNQSDREQFDLSLKQIQQPEVQKRIMDKLRTSLQAAQGIKMVEFKELPNLNKLANASTGLTLTLDMQGQQLHMDAAAFRRNNVGALTAVAYLNGNEPDIGVTNVARKLDTRILESTGTKNPSGN